MTENWTDTPLGGWAAKRPVAEVVDLAEHRARSTLWKCLIEPNAVDPVEVFDRMIGMLPQRPIAQFPKPALRRA
ncbi:hypothetical protein [Bosea sp. (in: a-proteobacteria)]|uniref:hypothetical protein n=1 Tax=Bosea sp. (in: a-proteobacteria) TaxID=1871050 RepID=UPI003B3A5CDB